MQTNKVEIHCPSCNKKGWIEVEENLVKSSARGITAVNVAEQFICDHSFVAYIDKNFVVRDCFITDFKIELPQIAIKKVVENLELPREENVDLYLISINLSAIVLAYIIRSGFLKKKIVILNDLGLLQQHLDQLLNYSFQQTFETDVTILNSGEYKKNKKQYKDYLVVEKQRLINDKKKLMALSRIKIESSIIQKFLGEFDQTSGLIILKNEIWKAYKLSKDIVSILDKLTDDKKTGKQEILNQVQELNNTKISSEYFEFLLEIAENYFKVELSKLSAYYHPRFYI